MGLDITAYKQLEVTENTDDEEIYFANNGYAQGDMPEIEYGKYLLFSDSFSFRAGSYGGYNIFRKKLCEVINGISDDQLWKLAESDKRNAEKLPFYWLINFTDCDGYIGFKFCEILYKDFCKYEEKYEEIFEDSPFMSIYTNFKKAFEVGRINGAVRFH